MAPLLGSVAADIRLPARQVRQQGSVNACLSCALATCLEAQQPSLPALSALFHFFNVVARWPNSIDEGMSQAMAYGTLVQHGICDFALHPLAIKRENLDDGRRPSAAAFHNALTHRPARNQQGLNPFRSVGTGFMAVNRWQAALARRQPILLIMHTNQAYWQLENGARAEGEIQDTWKSTDTDFTGQLHAASILGTSASMQAFIVQDCRGPTFGRGGQWYLKYQLTIGSAIDAAYTLEYPE